MLRRLLPLAMSLVLCFTTVACGGSSSTQIPQNSSANRTQVNSPPLNDGKYPVQQATYNDVDGTYNLMLLNTPAGVPPAFRTQNLQMARLTDEQVKAGEKTYLNVENGQPAMYLSEDFKIEYVHNVTETQTNPQTGQRETVIVRQESSFWTPFAGALAGQAIGSLLFRPQYYVPPVYQSGGILRGYGGYGSSYDTAVRQYQTRYNAPPAAVRNRETFRTSGSLRTAPPTTTTRRTAPPPSQTNRSRSTGSGYGSSTLRRSNQTRPTDRRPSGGSFGSGRQSSPRRSYSGGGRRRR
ncbi:hypothetical protein H6G50_09900 [Oscillatoria sp. FACHB-1406]|nr:hypothetical protein [Oscillatoria sp. FACHB-1406]MBD2577984.1 hypothetical protein [Oscillatoria sp. FACHB-1406]